MSVTPVLPGPSDSEPLAARRLSRFRRFPEFLLLFGVYGFALSLLIGRGTYEPALLILGLAVPLALVGRGSPYRLPRPIPPMLALGGLFLLQGVGVAARPIAGDFHLALAGAMIAATAVCMVPVVPASRFDHARAIVILLLVFVVANGIAYELRVHKLIRTKNPEAVAMFSNMHYLALYAVTTLPVLAYLTLDRRGVWRWLVLVLLAGDFWLLLVSRSRPGYLALIAAAIVTLPFLSGRLRPWVLAAVTGIPVLLYLFDVSGFANRVDDFWLNLAREERAAVWRETWQLQRGSSVSQWLFGHGLGQFFWDYQTVSSFHDSHRDHSSPHNYLTEVLYSHGVFGLLIFVAAYGELFRRLALATRRSQSDATRRVGIVLLSVTTAELAMGFFTIPFFSRHNLHPFSLVLGADLLGLLWMERHA